MGAAHRHGVGGFFKATSRDYDDTKWSRDEEKSLHNYRHSQICRLMLQLMPLKVLLLQRRVLLLLVHMQVLLPQHGPNPRGKQASSSFGGHCWH